MREFQACRDDSLANEASDTFCRASRPRSWRGCTRILQGPQRCRKKIYFRACVDGYITDDSYVRPLQYCAGIQGQRGTPIGWNLECAGLKSSKDTVRDVRGFAVKFYTDEGNWDIVGNDSQWRFLIIAHTLLTNALQFPYSSFKTP